jgi:ABC-type branched-subunit amino acid transport system substrate-binding protein
VQLAYLKALPAEPHPGRVAIFGYDTPQGQDFSSAVKGDAHKFGFSVAGTFLVSPTATDFSTQAAQIAQSHATAILSAVAGPSVATLMKDLKAVGMPTTTPITAFAGVAVPSAPWRSFAVVADFRTTGSEAGVVTYRHDVTAAGYDPSSPTVVEGYAGGLLVSQALGRCGYPCTPTALQQALNRTNTDLSGLAFGPVVWSKTFHGGPTVFSSLTYSSSGQPQSYAKPVTVYGPGSY